MESKVYISNKVAGTIESLPQDDQDEVVGLIDSLRGGGWKSGRAVAERSLRGERLRMASAGGFLALFTHDPVEETTIVTDVVRANSSDFQLAPSDL